MNRVIRFVFVGVFAAGGFCVGYVVTALSTYSSRPDDHPSQAEYSPLPHHVPEHAGGAGFRFAMAHDVLHERFPRHGPAYYRERDRLNRQKLAGLAPADPASFPLADDLAVGLERLGRTDEAITVMRDKLARQQAAGLTGRALYTSYANLGTFLIHANSEGLFAGNPAARDRFREGVRLVEESVKVNPQAHFGRERWQAAVAQFLLAAADDPALLRRYDCVGNRISRPADRLLSATDDYWERGYGRAVKPDYLQPRNWQEPAYVPKTGADDPARWDELKGLRKYIARVGAEDGWVGLPVPFHQAAVPFDDPVLGMVGMWRQGGGANPHFALAIGEIMLRVGQRHLAWAAFERARRLADRYGPDGETHQFLRDHCRGRQEEIALRLTYRTPPGRRWEDRRDASHPITAEEAATLRPRFEAELAHGEGYQKAYQEYEAAKIAAGVSIDDPHFWDEFHAGRPPIASPSGPEEWLAVVTSEGMDRDMRSWRTAGGVLGAGVGAAAGAVILRVLRSYWRR